MKKGVLQLSILLIAACTDVSNEFINDKPSSIGVSNAISNADQLLQLQYMPICNLPSMTGYYDAGRQLTGMLYSSTRYDDLFVPNNVSLYTFLSSLNNPYSYLYTVDLASEPYDLYWAKSYYGTVCTYFVEYALGIKETYTTRSFRSISGMEFLVPQSIDDISIGDVIIYGGLEVGHQIYTPGHAALIYDIVRDKEQNVQYVVISEAVEPLVRNIRYSRKEFIELMKRKQYEIYRYKYIDQCTHTPLSELIPSELGIISVMTKKGDKANYRLDETIKIDILTDQYTHINLFRDGKFVNSSKIESKVHSYTQLPSGLYEAYLSVGDFISNKTSFIVVDCNFSVESTSSQTITLTFEQSNGYKPVWVTWYLMDDYYPIYTEPINEEEFADGYKVSSYRSGKWGIKVFYETEYGIISSKATLIDVLD